MPVATNAPVWYQIVWSWPGQVSGASWVRAHSADSALVEFRCRLGGTYADPGHAEIVTIERGGDCCPECHRKEKHTGSCPLDW